MKRTSPEITDPSSPVDEEYRVNEKRIPRRRRNPARKWIILTLAAFVVGSFSGYFMGINSHQGKKNQGLPDIASMVEHINPPEGYPINVRFGDIGPQLIAAGAFRLDELVSVYQRAGRPLTEDQKAVLARGSHEQVILNKQNAYFLLNLFWALGLTNQNPILDKGPLVSNGRDKVVNFASTGGWSLAARPVNELYSSTPIVTLTTDQQQRLEEVVIAVFRPCCNNPTHFPDCNHGMAMLGMLELLASREASQDEMFEAAKYANAYWYPSQTLELAAYFQATQKVSFDQVDARQLLSHSFSSLSGYQKVHQWLSVNGILPQAPGNSSNCGV